MLALAFLGHLRVAAQVQVESKSVVGAQTSFEVRFKAFDNVYLNLGPGDALVKGMKLAISSTLTRIRGSITNARFAGVFG